MKKIEAATEIDPPADVVWGELTAVSAADPDWNRFMTKLHGELCVGGRLLLRGILDGRHSFLVEDLSGSDPTDPGRDLHRPPRATHRQDRRAHPRRVRGHERGDAPVHLLSVLSNFEPVQVEVKSDRASPEVTPPKTRSDLREQAAGQEHVLVERYRAGETVKTLAAEFGLHHGTVRSLLVDVGVKVRTRRRLTDEQLAQARDLYQGGRTTTEIGEILGCYASTVGRALVRIGVTLRPPGRPCPE